jgi:hypothetical protein
MPDKCLKKVNTYYYSTRDMQSNSTSNSNIQTNAEGDYIGFFFRCIYYDSSLLNLAGFLHIKQTNISNRNEKFSNIADSYLSEHMDIFELPKDNNAELQKKFEYEMFYKDNYSLNGVTSILKTKSKGVDNKGRKIHVTTIYNNDPLKDPVSWNPNNYIRFRKITINRQKLGKCVNCKK